LATKGGAGQGGTLETGHSRKGGGQKEIRNSWVCVKATAKGTSRKNVRGGRGTRMERGLSGVWVTQGNEQTRGREKKEVRISVPNCRNKAPARGRPTREVKRQEKPLP